jgi:hypothetical protein
MLKTNSIKCEGCKFGIPVDANERVLLCDNPDLKSYGKNVKHGRRFSCGYGARDDGWVTIEKNTAMPSTFFHRSLENNGALICTKNCYST